MKTTEEIRIALGLEPFDKYAHEARLRAFGWLKSHYKVDEVKTYYIQCMTRRIGTTTRMLVEALSLVTAGKMVYVTAPFEAHANLIFEGARSMAEKLGIATCCTKNTIHTDKGTLKFVTHTSPQINIEGSQHTLHDHSCYELESNFYTDLPK